MKEIYSTSDALHALDMINKYLEQIEKLRVTKAAVGPRIDLIHKLTKLYDRIGDLHNKAMSIAPVIEMSYPPRAVNHITLKKLEPFSRPIRKTIPRKKHVLDPGLIEEIK